MHTNNRERTGAEILFDTLAAKGIDTIFGHFGGPILGLIDEYYKRVAALEKSGIKHHVGLYRDPSGAIKLPRFVIPRHEQNAGHMAEGYARASGRIAAVIVTSGPGTTNIMTPLHDAFNDSTPVLFITGQVPASQIGKDSFQEAKTTNMAASISKYSYFVRSAGELGPILNQAHYIATTGRPGPVLIDICGNVFAEKTANGHALAIPRGYNPQVTLDVNVAGRIIEDLAQAKNPVIYAGGGILHSNAALDLRRFVGEYGIPVTTTLMGMTSVPSDHPLFLGMLGMHGTPAANHAVRDADFILALGARFDDRVFVGGFGRTARIAHVDIDNCELEKVTRVKHALHADVGDFIRYALSHKPANLGVDRRWIETTTRARSLMPKPHNADPSLISMSEVVREISDITKGQAVVATGVGQHQMYPPHYYNFQNPRSLLTSGSLGTMGYGMPAGIGAYYADPSRQVVVIDGDGSFQMTMQELGTIASNRIPIKIFVLNNRYLGMPRQWQGILFGGRIRSSCLAYDVHCPPDCDEGYQECMSTTPDIVKLVSAYEGIHASRASRPAELRPALEAAFAYKGPSVTEIIVHRTEDILPMIPRGKGIDDMIMPK